mmetsp:Transcript_29152/g.36171  ORF Transcript_29152/g.36171 Transcript_29152/m.36171 type:complete len:92 (+) Transcript_29152:84-359(+)
MPIDLDQLEGALSKSLVLCAKLRASDLIKEDENMKVKRFLFSVQDEGATLHHLAQVYERTHCLFKYRQSLAGFMGAPYLGRSCCERQTSPL